MFFFLRKYTFRWINLYTKTQIIMLVDLDYFFAQCEELRNPTLKEKAVVVGVYSGRTENSGVVSTANYLARNYGVHSGLSLYAAKNKLENYDAVFLPVDYEYYKTISNRIMSILRLYSDIFEQVGIDEAYLDISLKTQGKYRKALFFAKKMKSEIKKKIGISFSVGIGPNKLVAKISADYNKPDGITLVKPEKVEQFLAPLPVIRLPGVGKKTSKKMISLGINTIGALSKYDVQKLVDVFGRNLAAYYHNASNGINKDRVQEAVDTESISRISTLKENTRDSTLLIEKTSELVISIHKDVINRNLKFRRIGIVAVMTDLNIRSKSKTLFDYSNHFGLFKKTVQDLIKSFLAESEMEIRRVGVKVSQFTSDKKNQKQLSSYF
jgi:DNA polymerase IV (DinB-like DNA polymerase)